MERTPKRVVSDSNGRRGVLGEVVHDPATGNAYEQVLLDDGRTVLVLHSLFVPQADGSFLLPLDLHGLDQQHTFAATQTVLQETGEMIVPVIEESVQVGKRLVERGIVRVHKRVVERQETVAQTLQHQDVEIERVPINQVAATINGSREEGDTLIIPIYEEVVVVEKRLMLKEEVHIHRRQRTTEWSEPVTLRREEIEIERSLADHATTPQA